MIFSLSLFFHDDKADLMNHQGKRKREKRKTVAFAHTKMRSRVGGQKWGGEGWDFSLSFPLPSRRVMNGIMIAFTSERRPRHRTKAQVDLNRKKRGERGGRGKIWEEAAA